VSHRSICFDAGNATDALERGAKWFPYNKGGGYRKWYGNDTAVINWENNGAEIREALIGKNPNIPRSEREYFRKGITWGLISGASFSARATPKGAIFDVGGSKAFPSDRDYFYCLGLLNSKLATAFIEIINPTVNSQVGDLKKIPVIDIGLQADKARVMAQVAVDVVRNDWNSFEEAWGFCTLPVLLLSTDLAVSFESSYLVWVSSIKKAITELKCVEDDINRLFIDAYGLQDELTPEVPIEQITLTVNPAYRYGGNLSEDELWNRFRQDTIKELLSYATGCMMGRYSLDHPGLILANAGDTLEHYHAKVGKSSDAVAFQPDRDGIIPVLDGEWFEDDIVARSREFLRVCFPASSLNTDLAFIETALGKDLRKYFCSDFYKDHLQTYKKRPIYWLVQSPAGPAKGGFACLIYLHRYTKDTLNLVLNNYFRPYLQKLEARQAQLGLDQLNDDLPARDRSAARKEAEKITKVLKECQAWEQDSLLPLAQQRIELDLDDGVKVNYLKLQDVLAPIPGLAAKEE